MSETTDFKSNTKVIGGYCDMWVFLDFCLFFVAFSDIIIQVLFGFLCFFMSAV